MEQGGDHRQRLDALTSLRFFAAAIIVFFHSAVSFGIPSSVWKPFDPEQADAFFFVLSGFILTYVYPSLPWSRAGRFLWARFARLWPGYFVGLVLICIVYFGPPWRDPISFLVNLVMAQSWIPVGGRLESINGPAWSIATEAMFYVFFLFLIQSWRRTWWIKLPLTLLLAGGMILLARAYHLPVWAEGRRGMQIGMIVYQNPLARLFEFTAGMTAALGFGAARDLRRYGKLAGTGAEIVAIALVALLAARSAPWAMKAASARWGGAALAEWLAHGGIVCGGFAVFILIMAAELGWVSRLLSWTPLVILGETSYAVYLVHVPIITQYDQWQRAFKDLPRGLTYPAFWAVVLLTAHLTWRVLERPARLWLRRLLPARRPAADAAKGAAAVAATLSAATFDADHPHPLNPAREKPREEPPLHPLGWWTVAESAVLIAIVIAAAVFVSRHRCVSLVTAATATRLAEQGWPDARGVGCGGRFTLLGAEGEPTDDGLLLKLAWRSDQTQRLTQVVVVRPLDDAGQETGYLQYPFDIGHHRVPGGAMWVDSVLIHTRFLYRARSISIMLADANGPLTPNFARPADPILVRLPLDPTFAVTAPWQSTPPPTPSVSSPVRRARSAASSPSTDP